MMVATMTPPTHPTSWRRRRRRSLRRRWRRRRSRLDTSEEKLFARNAYGMLFGDDGDTPSTS
jgi:hypothetical protein